MAKRCTRRSRLEMELELAGSIRTPLLNSCVKTRETRQTPRGTLVKERVSRWKWAGEDRKGGERSMHRDGGHVTSWIRAGRDVHLACGCARNGPGFGWKQGH
eukprot:scaffold2274_cov343-Pavlova_lutheri.AAC.1